MKLSLIVFTDGRKEFLSQTLASWQEKLDYPLHSAHIMNDSEDPSYQRWLVETYPWATVVQNLPKAGFTGTIGKAWAEVIPADTNYVFHLEDDFVFRELPIAFMIALLDANPELVQIALKRQPVNVDELEAGGFMKQHPSLYEEVLIDCDTWVKTQRNFTTNPCIYRRSLCSLGWPQVPNSERAFGEDLLNANPNLHFGFVGGIEDEPLVYHIGSYRVGGGY